MEKRYSTKDLYTYASIFNMMMISEALGYPTKQNFVKDVMYNCLGNNIITKEASMHPIWNTLNIEVVETQPIELNNPYKLLRYSDTPPDPKTYWMYEFKKVMLPDGWKLKRGCSCGSNLNTSSFSLIDNNGNVIETLAYFNDMNDYLPEIF